MRVVCWFIGHSIFVFLPAFVDFSYSQQEIDDAVKNKRTELFAALPSRSSDSSFNDDNNPERSRRRNFMNPPDAPQNDRAAALASALGIDPNRVPGQVSVLTPSFLFFILVHFLVWCAVL